MTIPDGFVFGPSDEELVAYFLHPKVKGGSLPQGAPLLECDLYEDKNPWEILDKDRFGYFYVFTKLKKKHNGGNRFDRSAGSGTWKGQNLKHKSGAEGNLHWTHKDFVFTAENNKKKMDEQVTGHWLMTEFSLPDQSADDFVLCKIYYKLCKNQEESILRDKRKLDDQYGSSSSSVIDIDDLTTIPEDHELQQLKKRKLAYSTSGVLNPENDLLLEIKESTAVELQQLNEQPQESKLQQNSSSRFKDLAELERHMLQDETDEHEFLASVDQVRFGEEYNSIKATLDAPPTLTQSEEEKLLSGMNDILASMKQKQSNWENFFTSMMPNSKQFGAAIDTN